MGTLYYAGSEVAIPFDDQALAHLKVLATAKLRRGESFTVSWAHPPGERPGRSTIWLHPTIPLRFVFDSLDQPELDRAWLESLSTSANLSGGIVIDSEHVQQDHDSA